MPYFKTIKSISFKIFGIIRFSNSEIREKITNVNLAIVISCYVIKTAITNYAILTKTT
jgi:hypothetical protein